MINNILNLFTKKLTLKKEIIYALLHLIINRGNFFNFLIIILSYINNVFKIIEDVIFYTERVKIKLFILFRAHGTLFCFSFR